MDENQTEVLELLKRVYPFRNLEEVDLSWIAEAGEALHFDPGQDFYNQGESAEYFHFILEGEVNLNYHTGKLHASMGILTDDDQFGVEVVEPQAVYYTSAFAVTEGTLFRLHRETVVEMLHNLPDLAVPLQLLAHSLRLSLEVNLDWRAPDETVFYIDRRHPYFLWARLILPVTVFFGFNLPGSDRVARVLTARICEWGRVVFGRIMAHLELCKLEQRLLNYHQPAGDFPGTSGTAL